MELNVLMRNVKKIRLLKNFTMRYLSDVLNCDQGAYSRWESGESEPKVSHLLKLADLFEMTLDEIAEFNPDNPGASSPKKEFEKKMADYEKLFAEKEHTIFVLNERKVSLSREIELLKATLEAKTKTSVLLEEKIEYSSQKADEEINSLKEEVENYQKKGQQEEIKDSSSMA